jgi:hypothetical protein
MLIKCEFDRKEIDSSDPHFVKQNTSGNSTSEYFSRSHDVERSQINS